MISSRAPISFIATDRPEAARSFYADVLGLKLRDASPFALAFSDGDHSLRVQIVTSFQPASYTVHGWQVANIAKEIRELVAKGVAFQRYNQLHQDADGVWTTPDDHKVAWFKDPSGNILSLTEFTPIPSG